LGIVEIEIVNNNKLLTQIKQSIHAVDQNADIILYGSRSRGDSVSDSDWDLLILVDGDVNDERIDKIRYQLYEVEWESGEILSSIIRSRSVWNSSIYQIMPLHQRIEQEGLVI